MSLTNGVIVAFFVAPAMWGHGSSEIAVAAIGQNCKPAKSVVIFWTQAASPFAKDRICPRVEVAEAGFGG